MDQEFVAIEPRFVERPEAQKAPPSSSAQDWLIENARVIVGLFLVTILLIIFYLWWSRDEPLKNPAPVPTPPATTPPPAANPPPLSAPAPTQPGLTTPQQAPAQSSPAPVPRPAKKEPAKEPVEDPEVYLNLLQKSKKNDDVVIEMDSEAKETEPAHETVEITPATPPPAAPSYNICTAIMTSGYRCKKKAVSGDRCNLHQNR
jgi:pyruvate/2-oxoglutarate dehydrogenase complex dihydrolipoamide acyltransferase (E2) component